MDRATRKRIFNACAPDVPLRPGDARYVDIDALPGDVRGGSFVEKLGRRIELSDEPVHALVTAQIGAGLTTELFRLGARLSAKDGANLLVVHVAAQEILDLSSPLHEADLGFGLVAQAERVVAEATGKPVSEYFRRFWKFLTRSEVELGFSGGGPNVALRLDQSTVHGMRARFEADRHRIVNELQDELALLNDNARQAGHSGIVVILDGLDRLRGLSSNWREVLDSAERVFASDALMRRLRIHVVSTVPCALSLRPIGGIDFLPSISTRDGQDQAFGAGYAAAVHVLAARMTFDELQSLLDPPAAKDRLLMLIDASFGNVRDLLRLAQDCIITDPLTVASFSRILSLSGEPFRRLVTADMLPMLAEVHRSGSLAGMSRTAAEFALQEKIVLRFEAGRDHYQVHPAVRPMLVVGR